MKQKIIPAIAVAGLLLAGWVFLFGPLQQSSSKLFGAAGNMLAENYIPYVLYNGGYNTAKDIVTSAVLKSTGTFQLGSSGTARANDIDTTCSMIADNTVAGTSTVYAYCTGVTGVTSSDTIIASFASSSALMSDQWFITGAKASTTAGVIDFRILKLNGVIAATTMSSGTVLGSSTVIKAGH